jgi:signal transduction histidine kinase
MLTQKSRLAALGLADSKAHHELRNLLSSAQLNSDRLSASPDPTVQKFVPKLISSLDRAIALCAETLRYGRADEAAPQRHRFLLKPLVDEVGDSFGLPGNGRTEWLIEIEGTLEIDADRGQLYRILTNLVRNAVQVLEAPPEALKPQIRVIALRNDDHIFMSIADNGPGVPARARANLFQAFQGSVRAGGVGLGLAISAELARAHGVEIWLDESASGATFCLKFPHTEPATATSDGNGRNLGRGILAFSRSKH